MKPDKTTRVLRTQAPGEPRKILRYEITAIHTHPQAKVDVVLVHGLNGAPAKTWFSSGNGKGKGKGSGNDNGNGNDSGKNSESGSGSGVFWPSDLLPQALEEAGVYVNVLLYGYNADVYSTSNDVGRGASDNFIFQHAQTLVSSLTLYRKSAGFTNPIIWVAHSLGGILLKRALLYSNDLRDANHDDDRGIFVSTYAIIFLGTPHTGSGLATWARILQSMADAVLPRKFFESESVLLKTLKKDNETLQNINNHFLDIYQRFKMHMVHENHKTDLKGTKQLVVDAASASPQLPGVVYYGIEATHSGMCKFDSPSAPGYRSVSTAIREWAKEAPAVINTRWEVEKEDQYGRTVSEVHERLASSDHNVQRSNAVDVQGPAMTAYSPRPPSYPYSSNNTPALPLSSLSPLPVPLPASSYSALPRREPVFIRPQHFRPNSYFVGRRDEMEKLHKALTDTKRRSQGTSSVLIAGMAGSGKTHLARQYVFDYKDNYPGGVYWIRSTSIQDMESGFWQVAKMEAIKEMIDQEERSDLLNPYKMVEIVCNWFNEFDGWLLVLDGLRCDDPSAVSRFIPDRKNTALILTSTERAVAGNYLLDNPVALDLELLPIQDCQALLLEELERTPPFATAELRLALELAQLMDRLPLMIHAAAQHMRYTREPLSKYIKSFRQRPRVGMLPAYKAVWEQLQRRGDIEALNLMYILSFFSQRVPVEMLALGLNALDNRTPVRTRAHRQKRSLNGTFVTLIGFALVERTEMIDLPSEESKSSQDDTDKTSERDLLDILKIHTIVQAFFLDLLLEEGLFMFWLERAISVFCRSFDEADSKMQESSDLGLPDDYRRFAIHGERLLAHCQRIPKKQPHEPELIKARERLEALLSSMPTKVVQLQKAMSAEIVHKANDDNVVASGGDVPHASVFQRTHSFSTQPSLSSSSSRVLDDDHPQFESPTDIHNTHQFPSVYPYEGIIPAPPYQDELHPDDRTVSPQPSETIVGEHTPDEGGGWTRVERHRAVKKMDGRRYRDRAGAWRDTRRSNRDPRVGVSHESARGVMTPPGGRSSSSIRRSRVTTGSEAEAELMVIKQSSPPPARGGGFLQPKGRSPSTASASRWPNLGLASYADALSGPANSPAGTRLGAPVPPSGFPHASHGIGNFPPVGGPQPPSSRGASPSPSQLSREWSNEQDLSASMSSLNPIVNVMPPTAALDGTNAMPSVPHGYTSQPMSRNASSNSQALSDVEYSAQSASRGRGSARSSRSTSVSQRPGRPPSIVETEPSPRLPSFDTDRTLYSQAWDGANVHDNWGRRRGDSLFGDSNVPPARARGGVPGVSAPNFVAPRGSPDRSVGAGGNGSGSGSGGRGTPRQSPNLSAGGQRRTGGGGWSARLMRDTGGQPLVRSRSDSGASGGIHVGNGRLVEFGQVPVDMGAAAQRWVHERDAQVRVTGGYRSSPGRNNGHVWHGGAESGAVRRRRDEGGDSPDPGATVGLGIS